MRAFRLAVGTFVVQAKDIRAEQFDADAIVNVVNQVDANGPLALQGSVEGDPFKKTGRELRRIKEDDSGERLGFLSKVEGAEGSRTLNGSDLFSIPRQLGVQSSSPLNAHESSQPPEDQGPTSSFHPQEHPPRPSARESSIPRNILRVLRSYIPRVFGPEDQTVVPEEDNCVICLRPKNGEVCAPFECATVKHSFCKPCVESWVPINPTCPSCRTGLRSDSPLNALRTTEQQQQERVQGQLTAFEELEEFFMIMEMMEEQQRAEQEAEAEEAVVPEVGLALAAEAEEQLHINPDLEEGEEEELLELEEQQQQLPDLEEPDLEEQQEQSNSGEIP